MRILTECKRCRAQYDVSGFTAGTSVICRCGASVRVPEAPVHDARLVRCAACGATRGIGGDNCEFCGARFSLSDKGWGSMCPACFCRLPADANFCVECGLKIDPSPLSVLQSKLPCPRCACKLAPRAINAVNLNECPACGGLWLAAETFDLLCQKKETHALAMRGMSSKRGHMVFELSDAETVKYVPCPVCHELMNRRNFAQISGTIIDTCKSHGVWLDNQELSRILKFIDAGGLEKAHSQEEADKLHRENMRSTGPKSSLAGASYSALMWDTNEPRGDISLLGSIAEAIVRSLK